MFWLIYVTVNIQKSSGSNAGMKLITDKLQLVLINVLIRSIFEH